MEDNDLKDMFNILVNNMKSINNKFLLLDNDYELWKSNILKLKGFTNYLLKENNKLIGYFMGYRKDNNCYLCEIQIDDLYKGDHITFRKLITKFVELLKIDNNCMIYCNISINNIKSREVFMAMGMVNYEDNKYRMKADKLIEFINR